MCYPLLFHTTQISNVSSLLIHIHFCWQPTCSFFKTSLGNLNIALVSFPIVVKNRKMIELYSLAKKIAGSNIPVLITGETGVGKELFARYIHDNCNWSKEGKFISLNCAAVPENLIETELFGYRKGAFTGANEDKPGLMSVAHNGTLFLDEIGEMRPQMQAKLLRAVEKGDFFPVGSVNPNRSNFRLLCATNRDLEEMVHRSFFRDDLYFRLCGTSFKIPPLRDRVDEIPELVSCLIRTLVTRRIAISGVALEVLLCHSWPGNVRELGVCRGTEGWAA